MLEVGRGMCPFRILLGDATRADEKKFSTFLHRQ